MHDNDSIGRRQLIAGATASLASWACSQPHEGLPTVSLPSSRGGEERVGTVAPPWDVPWLGDDGPTLAQLRGRVVLLRFWTDTCPFCRASAPALVALDARFGARGVSVIGMYHPKPRGSRPEAEAVAAVAAEYGFAFPVGLDMEWKVLDAYWLSLGGRRFTSASFVIDQGGIIRFVHPGPEFHEGGDDAHAQCRDDFAAIATTLDALTV